MFQSSKTIQAIGSINSSYAASPTSYIDYTNTNFNEYSNISQTIARENKYGGDGTDMNVDAAFYNAASAQPAYVDEETGRSYFHTPAVGNMLYDYEKHGQSLTSMYFTC